MKLIFFIALISTLFLSASCGHIFSQSTEISPQNALSASKFTFYFMLETSLVSGDALYIQFPIVVGSPTAVVSAAFTGTTATNISTTYSATNFYTLGENLSANQWYQAVVTITDMTTQVAGVAGCVRFATTSATSRDYIIYDENRCFDVLSFAPAVNTQDLAVTGYHLYGVASSYKNPGSSYGVNFDVVPNVDVAGGATYVFTIASSDFTFVAPCSSIACTANTGETGTDYCPVNITALTATQYTCTVASNVLTYVVNTDINAGNYTRFQVQVSAPNKYVASAVAVSVQLRSKNAPIIFSTKAVTAGSINGIDLRTDLATVSAALSVSLFWGLAPTSVSNRGSGFTGCPINFYVGSTTNRIFNSFKTTFTPAAQITAYTAHNGLKATWTLASADVIETVVQTSLSTNLPGTVVIGFSGQTITISGITSLSAQTAYWIGVKFSLNPGMGVTYYTTQASPTSITWGGVVIAAADNAKNVGTFSGLAVGVRSSMYYGQDLATDYFIWGHQAFSYWSDSAATSPSFGNSVQAGVSFRSIIRSSFTNTADPAVTTTYAYSSGVWVKPSTTEKVQALLIPLKVLFPTAANTGAICVKTSTNYLGLAALVCDDSSDATEGALPPLKVLLKLGFNNRVLQIGNAQGGYAYGKAIGGLFTDLALPYSSTVRTTILDADRLKNTISGDSSTGLYYLSLLCQDLATVSTAPVNYKCFSAAGFVETDTAETFSGVALINTNIATYPTPYADSNVLDFLVCFKVALYAETSTNEAEAGKFQLVEEGCTSTTCSPYAGPSMINSYVVSGTVTKSASVSPMFSIVNGYIQGASAAAAANSDVLKKYIPAYLRVSFQVTYVAAGTMLGVFLNGVNRDSSTPTATGNEFGAGLLQYADAAGSVNIIDTTVGSSVNTATVMRGPYATAAYSNSNKDLWFVHHCIVIPTAFSTTSTNYNFYIPIQTTMASIDSINVVALGTKVDQAYSVSAVYRVAGSILSNLFINTPAGSADITNNLKYAPVLTPQVLTGYSTTITAETAGLSISSTGGDNVMQVDVTDGCFGAIISGANPTQPGLYTSATSFRPYVLQTAAVEISTSVVAAAGDTCLIATGNTGTTWGQAFIVYMRDKSPFFTSTNVLTWGLAGTDSVKNKCYYHNIKLTDQTASTFSMIYTIFCTADQHTGPAANSYGATTISIAANTFRVPFYWGLSYGIISKLNYAWSNTGGNLVAFNGEKTSTALWTYTSLCTVTTQTVSYGSYDVPFVFTISGTNEVTYTLAQYDSLTLTVGLGSWLATVNSLCSLSSYPTTTVSCLYSTSTITLTNLLANPITLTTIAVSTWVDTNGISGVEANPTAITVKTSLNASSSYIEQCSSVSGGGFQATGSPLSNSVNIQVSSFSYLNNLGARGPFSFTFSYFRIVRAGYYVSLDLGGWMTPTASSANYRCLVLDGSAVSHQWSTITPIEVSTGVSTLTVKTQYSSGGTWTFKCLGGNTVDASASGTLSDTANQMSGVLKRSDSTAISNSSLYFTAPTPSGGVPTALTVSLTKTFKTRGFDSDYAFSFIPVNNYTTAARFIVEFSQAIPPKLNAYGVLECYVNDTPAYCTFNEERRVVVWTTIALSSVVTYPYNVKIAGVTQPNYLADWDTNLKIWFAIDSNNDLNGGVSEAGLVDEQIDTVTSTAISSILIHSFSIGSNKFRSSTSFTYVLNLPAGSLTSTEGTPIWVTFPGSIRQFLLYGGSPSITFVRVGDSTSTNLVTRVQVFRGGRVAFRVSTDATNILAMNYTLTIGGVTTPSQGSVGREDFRIFLASDNVTVTASTAAGCRNSTTYINWDATGYTSEYTLNWADAQMNAVLQNPVPITMGTYQLIYLIAQGSTFKNTFEFGISSSGSNSSSFVSKPKDPAYAIRAVTGTTSAPVYIGANTGSAQGRYFIPWTRTDSSGQYSAVPTLDVVVSALNCTPSITGNSFNVPFAGGTSDPIIIDFSMCVPLSDVTVLANITSGFNLSSETGGLSFAGSQTQSSSLSFSDMKANYKMYFYVSSNSGSNGTSTLNGAATITFTMGGTNGANINAPSSVTINLVVPNLVAPIATTPSVTSSVLSVGCDQSGLNYFAVGTNTNAASYDVAAITAATETVKIALTQVDPNDPKYISLGYIAGVQPNVLSTMSLAGNLKATANMTVYSYCRSNSLIASAAPAIYNWTQPDNGGQTVVLTAKFTSKITSAQKISLACALVKNLAVLSRFVKTDEGTFCTTLRLLQDNSTNTTNTTTNTTANVSYSTNFYILKNYLAANDNTSNSVIASAAQTNFLSSLISSINDASFPTPASSTFTVTPVVITSGNASVIPVVTASDAVVDYKSANITFNLTNLNGLVYAGILAVPESGNISSPNNSRLIQGYDGNNTMLTDVQYLVLNAGGSGTINFTNLINSTNYTIYYAGSNLDVGVDALYSQVAYKFAVTSAPPSTFGNIMKISMLLLGALFLGLFGMI